MTRSFFVRFATLAAVFAALGTTQPAWGLPPIWKEFEAKYVTPNADATKALKSAKCNVCHVEGEEKKVRNPFGAELDKLIDGAALKELVKAEPDKAKEQIIAALEKVVEQKAAPDDEQSPTFGQLIAQGKLPGEPVKPKSDEPKPDAEKKEEEKPAEEAKGDEAKAGKAGQIAQLLSELVGEQVASQRAALKAELLTELKADLRTQLRAELRPQLRAEILADLTPHDPEAEKSAIAKIEELGGTVRPIAMNDDSKDVDFHLEGKGLTDEGLAYVKHLAKVVDLHLKDTQVTDAGLAQIANLVTLKRLHLEKTKVTDAGLAHLNGLGQLEYLNLYGTAVTDRGLENLVGLAKLKKLYVWQTQVTDEGVQQLQSALPDLEVVR